jgi:hypothetical protein
MILKAYGQHGWFEKVKVLQLRTDWFCAQLDALALPISGGQHEHCHDTCPHIAPAIASQYDLVPQQHNGKNHWYKIVVMEHVAIESLSGFLEALAPYTQTTEKQRLLTEPNFCQWLALSVERFKSVIYIIFQPLSLREFCSESAGQYIYQ